LIKRQSTIITGATGTTAEVEFLCPEPAHECRWGNFTTLGICGEANNVTTDIKPVCSEISDDYDSSVIMSCEFDFEKTRNSSSLGPSFALPANTWNVPDPINMTWRLAPYDGFTYLGAIGSLGYTNGGGNLDIVRHSRIDQRDSKDAVPMEAWMVQWYWCEYQFTEVVASPARIKMSNMTTEPLYRIEGSYVRTSNTTVRIPNYYIYHANSTGHNYTVENSNSTDSGLFSYLADAFTNNLVHDGNSGSLLGSKEQNLDKGLNLGGFLHGTDLRRFAKNMAQSLTVQVRQGGSVGDNRNSESFRGTATYTVTFYRVRWGWLTLPFAEALATAVLLAYTVFASRQQPLFKSSQLAYLAYGLGATDREELQEGDLHMSGSGLGKTAGDLVVKFKVNHYGRPGFMRT
jgi:hypothetical protein